MSIRIITSVEVRHNLSTDQSKAFLSTHPDTFANALGFNFVPSVVKDHWSFISESSHGPARCVANWLFLGHLATLLSLIVNNISADMSHTYGHERFTSAILMFGAVSTTNR